ncbi:MAG: hypothetical protein R3E70_15540 [Burkholderiaceae bacterium]
MSPSSRRTSSMIAQAVAQGRLSATTSSVAEAVSRSEISLICVGTPSQLNGNLDLSYVARLCEQIGEALRAKTGFHVVVARFDDAARVDAPGCDPDAGTRIRQAGWRRPACATTRSSCARAQRSTITTTPPKTVIGESDRAAGDLLVTLYAKLDPRRSYAPASRWRRW